MEQDESSEPKRFTYSLGCLLYVVTAICIYIGVELAFAGRVQSKNAPGKICIWVLIFVGAYLHHRAKTTAKK